MKRSHRRNEVIGDYIKAYGGFNGRSVIKAWLSHWHDIHPRLTLDYSFIRIYDKSITLWGKTIQLVDPQFFQKVSVILAAHAIRRRRSK